MTRYKDFLERKRKQYGERFDASTLSLQFIPYFDNQKRIEVTFHNDKGEEYERKRGRVGITTGWKPIFLLMLTKRSMGSIYTLSEKDRIVKEVQP